MKKGLIALSIIAVLTFAAADLFSQGWGKGNGRGYGNCGGPGNGKGYGPGMGLGRLEAMKADLGLSDDQVKKIFDLDTKYREKYFESRGSNDKMETLRTEHSKDIEKVLNKDQAEKFKNYYAGKGRCGNCNNR